MKISTTAPAGSLVEADGPGTGSRPVAGPPGTSGLRVALFGRRWPGPAEPPPLGVLVGAALAGVAAAVALPTGPAGIGWLITALVAVGAVGVVRWRARPAAADGSAGAAAGGAALDGAGIGADGPGDADSDAGGPGGAAVEGAESGVASTDVGPEGAGREGTQLDGVGPDGVRPEAAEPTVAGLGGAGVEGAGLEGAGPDGVRRDGAASGSAGPGSTGPGGAGTGGAGTGGAGLDGDALIGPGLDRAGPDQAAEPAVVGLDMGEAAVGRPDRPRPVTPADLGWAALAVASTAVGTVRAAPWLAALCLLGALAAAALAVTGRSFRGLPASIGAAPVAMLRALPWIGRAVHGPHGGPAVLRTVVAGLVGLVLLAVFVPLLASADAAFANVVDGLLPTVDGDWVSRWVIVFGLAAGAVAGACFLLLAPPAPPAGVSRGTRLRTVDWALPTALLVAVFGLFVAVQFVALFGGDDYVLRTTGLTYAEYARSGFWQLLAVTVLTLGVLAVGSRWAPAATAAERAWKRGLLGTLANLTLIIVVSAGHRMWLYQQAYGFTVMRLLVLTCELWLGVGFVLALVAVLRLRPAGLARPMLATGLGALLGLALLNPERFIAEHNVARWAETGRIDVEYLSGLSVDAVPVLAGLPEPLRTCTLAPIGYALDQDESDWRDANLARAAARPVLAEVPPTRSTTACTG